MIGIIAVVVLAALALGAGITASAWQRDDESTRADAAQTTAEDLCDQVEALGGTCVRDPDKLKGDPGEEGLPGPAGVGIKDMDCVGGAFVVTYTDGTVESFGDCVAESGGDGENGKDGAAGKDGQDGADGEPGPSGPAGPQGPSGEDGQDGDDGRSVDHVECDENGDLIITYSDETTENAGKCRGL